MKRRSFIAMLSALPFMAKAKVTDNKAVSVEGDTSSVDLSSPPCTDAFMRAMDDARERNNMIYHISPTDSPLTDAPKSDSPEWAREPLK